MTTARLHSKSTRRQYVGVILLSLDQDGSPSAALFQLRDDLPNLPYPNQWVFPGGQLESTESLEAGAYRELIEETGYTCKNLVFLCSGQIQSLSEPVDVSIFWSVYDNRQKIECYEGQEMRFIRRDQAEQYSIPEHIFSWWDKAIEAFHSQKNQSPDRRSSS